MMNTTHTPDGPGTAGPASATAASPVLEVVGLRKHFGDHAALDGIDLTVNEGEVVAVLGPSGSGKSTLVRCLDQLETIDGGAMYLDGELLGFEQGKVLRPLTDAGVRAQRRRMSMVFQQFNLFQIGRAHV